ncbi:MAG: hypothetical protein JWN70_6775 [Planctomycetaceae bacterium]|nr:hypothetical protein [Planctomycetaceae bacterium]
MVLSLRSATTGDSLASLRDAWWNPYGGMMYQIKLSVLSLSLLCLLGIPRLSAEDAKATKVPVALQNAVDSLTTTLRHWPVQHIDPEPTVAVDGQRGYRVVLRRTWKEPPPGTIPSQRVVPQSERDESNYVTKHTDWHFVLVPVSEVKLSPEAKREILWHVPDEKEFRLPVALGEGHGFVWFSYASIPMQNSLRERLMLTGGDDRLQLLLRGLSAEDYGMNTRNSVIPLFVQFGAAGLTALDKATQTSNDPTSAIRALSYFRDPQATTRLIELYEWSNADVHRAVASALSRQPFRPAAKAVYLDMLDEQLQVTYALQACLEFGWKDALSLIERVIEKPSSLGAYREAYKTYRQLSGNPIDAKILAAADVIDPHNRIARAAPPPVTRIVPPTDEALAAARQTIIETADVKGATFIGFSLATYTTKGNSGRINQQGIAILQALPRPAVQQMLNQLLNGLDESDRWAVDKVLQQVP